MELQKKILLLDKSCNKKKATNTKKFSKIDYLILKKIKIIIALAPFFTVNVSAHTTKSNWIVERIGGFYNTIFNAENTNSTVAEFELMPNIGYFIKDKFVLSLAPKLTCYKLEYGSAILRDGIESNPGMTSYDYFQNKPLIRNESIGLTDFTLDKKTGQLTQVGEKNHQPDRILKTDSKGNVKKKGEGFLGFLVPKSEKGKVKIDLDNIEQGILKEGMNFKENDNLIAIGGIGQASVKGFEDFALKFSNYIGREIEGEYFSESDNSDINQISIGGYSSNTATSAEGGLVPTRFIADLNLVETLQLRVHYHTHLSMFRDSGRIMPSEADLKIRAGLPFGVKSIIITNPNVIDYSTASVRAFVFGKS